MIVAAVVGAVLAMALHLGFVLALAPGTESAAAERVAEALRPLEPELLRFHVGLALVMVGAGALLGVAQRSLRLWARLVERPLTRVRAALVDCAATLGVFALLLVRANGAHPALFDASVGRGIPVVPPPLVDTAVAALVLAAVVWGAYRRHKLIWLGSVGGVAGVTAGIVAVWPDGGPPRAFTRPHVVIVAGDSLRPDHFSSNGYARPTTPNIDSFAATAASFDDAISPFARTVPAWISILTGLYPHHHGARHVFPTRARRLPALPSIARAFRDFGYRTVAVSDMAGDFFQSFDLGFDSVIAARRLDLRTIYEREVLIRSPFALALLNNPVGRFIYPVIGFMPENADADRLASAALPELRGAQEQPLFMVVFFSTTHLPWAASYPFFGRFQAAAYDGPHRHAYLVHSLGSVGRVEAAASPADVEQAIALYDSTLAEVDAAMGRILRVIDGEPAFARAVVMVTADHGAALFEDGTASLHGSSFKNDLSNRVPWLIRAPGVAAGLRIPETVSLVDLAPTLADLAGVPFPRSDGQSYAALLRGESPERPSRPAFAETGLWLTGKLDEKSMRTPPIDRLLWASDDDDYFLVLRPRYEDRVVEAKHRLARRGKDRLVCSPTPSGVIWSDPASPLREPLLEWLAQDPLRVRDTRDHFVRNDSP